MPRSVVVASDPIHLLEQAEVLRRRAEQSFGEYALEAGRLLIAAKRRIPHGAWAEHIAAHTGFSLRTAEVYMRARRRYDALPEGEKQTVLEQPFTRSLLVLAQAPKVSAPSSSDHELPAPRHLASQPPHQQPQPNGQLPGQSIVDEFLSTRETTELVEAGIDYHAQPDFVPEALPLDDLIQSHDARPATSQEISDEQLRREQQELFDQTLLEVERLEADNRQLQRELTEARTRPAAAASQQPSPSVRGWDYVQNLAQYLKADEPNRTPESLAKRAAALADGREVIGYLAMFFQAARTQLAEMA
jgi:hypothetical protein